MDSFEPVVAVQTHRRGDMVYSEMVKSGLSAGSRKRIKSFHAGYRDNATATYKFDYIRYGQHHDAMTAARDIAGRLNAIAALAPETGNGRG